MKTTTPKPSSVREFQEYLNKLYIQPNKTHSLEYIYGYLNRNCSYLSRSITRNINSEEYFIKAFSWLFALSSKLDINLESAFRKKFPNKCPYCISNPCLCAHTGKVPPSHKSGWEIKETLQTSYEQLVNTEELRHLNIDAATKLVNELYPSNRSIWNIYGSSYQFSRLFEELGEVHEAIGAYLTNKRNLEIVGEELADVFAWLASAWGIANGNRKLSEALISYYYSGCPVCEANPCGCGDYQSRDQALVNPDDLDRFKKFLIDIISETKTNNKDLELVAQSIDQAKESKSTTEATRAIAQGVEVLSSLATGTESAIKVTENTKNLIQTALAAAKTFPWFS
ncbi:hypothetical protein [Pseudomonas putida]|uniref:hypothetical protein n=1 Tax=Pseudomonas putida TaxID=303 RepID=UPI002AC45B8F|nr:hypothetical protein [Pseudomonas putida]MDZ5109801.1 hypothetical protein [Pseudomonas putida]